MSIICNRAALHDLLRQALPITRVRTPREILACARLTAGDDRLLIEANNLTMCVRLTGILVQVEKPFAAAAHCERLAAAVGTMDDETVKLAHENDRLTVRGDDGEFELPALPAADFPAHFAQADAQCEFTVSGADLARMIRQARAAAADEQTRYAFNSILIAVDKHGHAIGCGTDGHKLVKAPLPAAEVKGQASAIIPKESATAIERAYAEVESVRCAICETSFAASTEYSQTVTNLLEGQFPLYDDVIPQDAAGSLRVGRESLLALVRRAMVVVDPVNRGLAVSLSRKAGITIESRSPDFGRHESRLACKYDGPDMRIGINGAYLTELLEVCETEEIELRVNAPNQPVRIGAGETVMICMPMNLT